MNATATPARFAAVRAEGRYRVQDTTTGEYVVIAASRAKAEYAAQRLNDQEAEAADRPVMSDDELDAAYAEKVATEDAARAAEDSWGIPAVPAMKPCDGTCCPAEVACDTRAEAVADAATSLSKRAAAATASEDRARAIAAARAEVEAHAAEVATKTAAKPAAAKGKVTRLTKRVWTVLADTAGLHLADADPATPVLARLAEAPELTDGGRSTATTPEERAALRDLIARMIEHADDPVTRRSLAAFAASPWLV